MNDDDIIKNNDNDTFIIVRLMRNDEYLVQKILKQ